MRLGQRTQGTQRNCTLAPRASKAEAGEEAKEQTIEKTQAEGFAPRKKYPDPMSVGWAPTALR